MKKNAMTKNLLRTIKGSLGRYLAIVCIIALGAAIFVGLLSTKADMIYTGQTYMDQQNMFDLQLLSTYGWSQEEVDAVAQMPGIDCAEGSIAMDAIGQLWRGGKDAVYKLHSLPKLISKPYILKGRMPQNANECLVDGYGVTDEIIGSTFTVSQTNTDDLLDQFAVTEFTVVGYVSSPLYIDSSRGTTTLGNGVVTGYVYLHEDAFDVDYYTQINVTLKGDFAIYSEEFKNAMTEMAETIKPDVKLLAQNRVVKLKADAEKEYAEGWQKYEDGLKEFETGREEAYQKLNDALAELENGQAEIDTNRQTLEDALKEMEEGQKTLDEQAALLEDSRKQLLDGKAEAYAQFAAGYAELMKNYKTVTENLKLVEEGLPQIEDGLKQIDDGLKQIDDGLKQIEDNLPLLEMGISLKAIQVSSLQASLDAANAMLIVDKLLVGQLEGDLEFAKIELQDLRKQYEEVILTRADLENKKIEVAAQREELLAQKQELTEAKKTLTDAMTQLDMGLLELQNAQVQAENQFAAAQAQIESGALQLAAGQKELDAGRVELEAGFAALEEAQAQLDEGRAEYEKGKAEADAELAKAEQELADAAQQLADAKEAIDSMADAEIYILDRNTNTGYTAFNSNADILAGVSRVFPAFFLLVAALVCITTMTRMVEEERTQIGTLKALGYSNSAIMGKYLAYAGSAAVVGCGLGVLLGSAIFPMIIWSAYCIILNITPHILLKINWPLCLAVVSAYTVVMLLVTWYCCRRSLKEVAAELIRPKAPNSGKKIFLEYLPFWKHIGFLNKVMLRNVFRYRQRMFMMLIGIGGCTALLLTGFGLRDTIANTATDQFENVTTNDLTVYFSEAQTQEQQDAFRDALDRQASDILFFYQTSVDVSFDGAAKEIYLVAGDESLKSFINFTQDGEKLGMPGPGKTFLSIGVAENLGVKVGDTVTLTDPDMRQLTVEVSGIYHNSVYNYAIVEPETIEAQWGSLPGSQMAFVRVEDYCDHHEVGAFAAEQSGVMNVIVTDDIAGQVGSMLSALDAVVLTIIICAGALAMIVLYNLTNINITERIREIATIKVLGFHAKETAAYVFKENLLLSFMGMIVGLGGGWLLLKFVMNEIRVDMVWFVPTLQNGSVTAGMVMTMLAACLVDFLLYFKLEKINMAEALKSVE